MLKVIFFDWDGTCHNSIPKITESYIYAMTQLGYEVDLETLRAHYGEAIATFPKNLCPENPDKYFEIYINKYNSLPEAELYEGARETLLELKKYFTLALVTGKPTVNIYSCLKHVEMDNMFDFVVSGEECKRGKPYPDPLLKALEHYNIDPKDTVYVGDSKNDVLAAKAANVPVIGVTWGAIRKNELSDMKAEYIADTWQDVIDICLKLK